MTDDSPTPDELADSMLRATPEDPTVTGLLRGADVNPPRERLAAILRVHPDSGWDHLLGLVSRIDDASESAQRMLNARDQVAGLAKNMRSRFDDAVGAIVTACTACLALGLLLGWWLL